MIRQSFAWWSFAMAPDTDARALLAGAADAGAKGVEMLPDDLWPVAQDLGLTVVTLSGHALETGFNDPSRHAALRDEVRRRIDDAAAGGCEAVIVFSGSRIGDGADAPAIAACVEGLGPVVAHAKASGVRLLLELLNSKVDHPGQQCDRTAFGAAVVRQLDDPALRLLYDGYHMQLMEGDLSRTITDHLDLIGHHERGVAATVRVDHDAFAVSDERAFNPERRCDDAFSHRPCPSGPGWSRGCRSSRGIPPP